ncbi:TetR/AcrR family transcriptional regulator [Aeromicrobium sp.]|uniref:TetR/AcrR family transcriptional regulator n=1 Tax=Aeromicrobium sp. TaxID=1871063 RepID=UPI0028AF94D5|nr:TetR/AcrR family transcriptional regulator [Aeromicrobium sp.]
MSQSTDHAGRTLPPTFLVDRERAERRIEEFWDERATGASRRILRGATLAFADLGYHGASTREIATRAGMSPAAVYIHFESKQELFHRIALEGHRASTGSFNDPARQAADPLNRLRLGVASFTTWLADMNLLARSLEYEIRLRHEPEFDDVWALRRGIDTHMNEILQAGIDDGVFRIADPALARITILSICIDVSRWYRHGSSRTPMTIGFQHADLAMSLVGASEPSR